MTSEQNSAVATRSNFPAKLVMRSLLAFESAISVQVGRHCFRSKVTRGVSTAVLPREMPIQLTIQNHNIAPKRNDKSANDGTVYDGTTMYDGTSTGTMYDDTGIGTTCDATSIVTMYDGTSIVTMYDATSTGTMYIFAQWHKYCHNA